VPSPVIPPGNFGISPTVMSEEIVPLVWQIGDEAQVPVIDVYSALDGHPDWFPDRVHPKVVDAAMIGFTVCATLWGE
jgi:hypothetical protein